MSLRTDTPQITTVHNIAYHRNGIGGEGTLYVAHHPVEDGQYRVMCRYPEPRGQACLHDNIDSQRDAFAILNLQARLCRLEGHRYRVQRSVAG